jgi:hypothetical protein
VADDTLLIVSRVVFKENHLGLADERELGDVGLQSISGTKQNRRGARRWTRRGARMEKSGRLPRCRDGNRHELGRGAMRWTRGDTGKSSGGGSGADVGNEEEAYNILL